MFNKYDNKFADAAVSPELRAIAISSRSKTRAVMFCSACVMSAMMLVASYGSHRTAELGLALVATMQWIIALKFDSDVKLLKIAARFQENGRILG